jgi:uncharacterized metal-binding protein YceD (DUF177 family)
LLDSETTAFPGAAMFRVTVQVDVVPLAIVDGLQLRDVTLLVAAFTVTVAWADPL